jgi:hypothetical protein
MTQTPEANERPGPIAERIKIRDEIKRPDINP